ncbi:conserved hypothetical protein [Burkholderia latens]|uniref:hypothetical protein n=1 Tax=Burkholderia latens TaxID=488446 RepID=UPI001C988CDE|nr:hypothetical protein [Burkholderia latens]MBY4697246.1 hypothetical protein [Burkholderia latens]
MGIALAGVVFRTEIQRESAAELVSKLFNKNVAKIEAPNRGEFDIRSQGDVMVQFFDNVCFVYSHDLVWQILSDPMIDGQPLISATGSPDLLLVFCQYDSGGSFGYTFFEHGVRSRSRLQTTEVPGLPPILERGTPKDFEVHWFSASTYFEEDDCPREEWQKIFTQNNGAIRIAEFDLTRRLLYEALVTNFGVCPWETDRQSETFFFRLQGA